MSSIVIDTSSFIAFLRGEDKETLPALLLSRHVILSAVVKLELLAGVRRSEVTLLEDLLGGLPQLPELPPVEHCKKLLKIARGRGLFGGLTDIMILADCERTKSVLFTLDKKLLKLSQELKIQRLEIDK